VPAADKGDSEVVFEAPCSNSDRSEVLYESAEGSNGVSKEEEDKTAPQVLIKESE